MEGRLLNTTQLAQTVLRLGRKRGLTFSVERPASRDPVLHVSPKHQMTLWLREAIRTRKVELIAILDAEGQGTCVAADGTVWHQELACCDTCGASDWGVIGQERRKEELLDLWGCVTCHTSEETLRQAITGAQGVQVLSCASEVDITRAPEGPMPSPGGRCSNGRAHNWMRREMAPRLCTHCNAEEVI